MRVSIAGNKSIGWELVLDGEMEPVGVVENASYEEALDIFAANWPQYASQIDELKCEDLIGAVVEKKIRQARSGGGERKRGSGARFRELILQGKANDECVKIVREEFPESRATISDAAWQRAQLRKNPEKFMSGTAWELNSQVIKRQ